MRYNEELPDVLLKCTQLTSLCFHSGYSTFDLPVGPYLNNLEEIAVESYRAKPSLFKQVTKLQRLFLWGPAMQGMYCHRQNGHPQVCNVCPSILAEDVRFLARK